MSLKELTGCSLVQNHVRYKCYYSACCKLCCAKHAARLIDYAQRFPAVDNGKCAELRVKNKRSLYAVCDLTRASQLDPENGLNQACEIRMATPRMGSALSRCRISSRVSWVVVGWF